LCHAVGKIKTVLSARDAWETMHLPDMSTPPAITEYRETDEMTPP